MILATGFSAAPVAEPRKVSPVKKPEAPQVKLLYEDAAKPKALPKTPEPLPQASKPADDDEDLDIPTFLRRLKK